MFIFIILSCFSCGDRSSHEASATIRECGFLLDRPSLRPQWAVSFGDDDYGTWAEFSVAVGQKKVMHLMRWIPPGEFLMGSCKKGLSVVGLDHSPAFLSQRAVRVEAGFWIGETSCTQELWAAVMGDNPSWHADSPQSPLFPVESVNHEMVQNFLLRLSQLVPGLNPVLPTEKQWEYAARAGETGSFSLFPVNTETINCRPFIGDVFIRNGRFRGAPVIVRSLPPNSRGLFEVHGNVWEMCSDVFDKGYVLVDSNDQNAVGGEGYKYVVRGGAWSVEGLYCTLGTRSFISSRGVSDDVGFRIVSLAPGPDTPSDTTTPSQPPEPTP